MVRDNLASDTGITWSDTNRIKVSVKDRVLTLTGDVQKLPRAEWDTMDVRRILMPYRVLDVVRSDAKVSEVLMFLNKRETGQVPVVRQRRIIGMLSLCDVLLRVSLISPSGQWGRLEVYA